MTAQLLHAPEQATTTPGTRRGRRISRRSLLVAAGVVLVLVVVCLLWQLAYDQEWVNPLFLSNPVAVATALWNGVVHGELLGALGITLYETIVGFLLALVSGMVVGTLLHQLPLVNRIVRPYLTLLNNLPRLALAPIFVLWFGVGREARIALVLSFVFFVIALNTQAGLLNTDRDRLVLAKALGAGRFETFWKFQVPEAIPTWFAGFQLGLTYSFLGAIVGEMLTGGDGIGAEVSIGLAVYRTDQVYAEIIIMAVVATLLSGAIRVAEERLLRWRRYELRGLAKR
ncbi:ABC transporter permease [Amycolatopsis rhabdoformis]|uniref:ABC transporter permease n=1 Tax=Amycolatopsis rhabdoformis TaxID=1448059 RepID=A0ABZ1IBQ5_9PSEU|nr:ABC transporter permease [Amycolatopsis rhabdoformis]WSE31904.1 ABC transporter permease [Amycolatopsis rhabdoformis]